MYKYIFILIVFTSCSQINEHEVKFKKIEQNLVKIDNLIDWMKLEKYDTIKRTSFDTLKKELNIPGISLAVIDNYEIVYKKQYGVVNAINKKPVKHNTVFQSGSVTKLLALIIVLQSEEKGFINIDEDINKYLQSWKMPEHESGQPVTLRMLLTHQAGINRPGNGIWHEGDIFPTLNQVLNGEFPSTSEGVKFEFAPGEKHQYSNHGYLIIQKVLEDVYGKKYDQIVKEHIFLPLHMHNSTVEYPLPDKIEAQFISGHNPEGIPSEDDGLHPHALAQAAWMSSPNDMAIFGIDIMKAIVGQKSKLISNESAQKIMKTERNLDYNFESGIKQQGFGCFILGKEENKYFFHYGHNQPPGANAILICHPKTGKGLSLMTNGELGLYFILQFLPAIAEEYDWPSAEN